MGELSKRDYIKKYFEYYYHYCDDSKYLDFFKQFIFNTDYDFLECSLKFKEDSSVVGNRINLYYESFLFEDLLKLIEEMIYSISVNKTLFEEITELMDDKIYSRVILGYDLSDKEPIFKIYFILIDFEYIEEIFNLFNIDKKKFNDDEIILGLRIFKNEIKLRLYFYNKDNTLLKKEYPLLETDLIDKFITTYEINWKDFIKNKNNLVFNSFFLRLKRESNVFKVNKLPKKVFGESDELYFWCKINNKNKLKSIYV